MLTSICLNHLRTVGRCLRQQARRNIGVSAVVYQQAEDPIQQLFVQKIREYAQKQKTAGGKFVDATPENMQDFERELNRLRTQYKVTSDADFAKFPQFQFKDVALETTTESARTDPTDLPL